MEAENNRWVSAKVIDLQNIGLLLVEDGNHGEYRPRKEEFGTEGVSFIRAADMNNGRVLFESAQKIDAEARNRIRKGIGCGGDVILSHKGTVGKVAYVPLDAPPFVCSPQTTFWRSLDQRKIDRRYLNAYLSSHAFQSQLFSRQNETDMAGYVSLTAQRALNIILPPIEEQQSIARILGTLDEKIELNRKMNATLESMAQALFKSWFVDFDPVIDNALEAGNPIPEPLQARTEGRKALGDQRKQLPEHIHSQFPSSFVFSDEMGWVPEGWIESTIGDQVETTGGGTPSTKETTFWENGTHAFCTPKDMSMLNSLVMRDTVRHLTDAGVKKISSGQLPVGTVVMSSRAPIGYLAVSEIPVSVNQGIIAMLPNAMFSPMYLTCWTQFNMQQITDRANGSTFLEISKKNFKPIPFLVPQSEILEVFNEQTESLYSKLRLIDEEVESLTTLRDTLLPKLLSGQLRIPDAEKQLAEAI